MKLTPRRRRQVQLQQRRYSRCSSNRWWGSVVEQREYGVDTLASLRAGKWYDAGANRAHILTRKEPGLAREDPIIRQVVSVRKESTGARCGTNARVPGRLCWSSWGREQHVDSWHGLDSLSPAQEALGRAVRKQC